MYKHLIIHKYILICIAFAIITMPLQASRQKNVTIDSLISAVPDSSSDPQGYRAWKLEYTDMLERRARPMDHTYYILNNGYVDFVLDDSTGSYDQGCRPDGTGRWSALTYGYNGHIFFDTPPWDYTIYKIDDHTPQKTFRGGTGCDDLRSPDSVYILGNECYTIWNDVFGVKIVQILECVSLGSERGDIEQVKRTNLFIPVDDDCHRCGCLVHYDTMLDFSDGANIATAFGYVGRASIHIAPAIPPIWRAFEYGAPPNWSGIEALGILMGYDATMPDVFWYGEWWDSEGCGWETSEWQDITGDEWFDTAAMIKWNRRYVCPGDTLRYCTYYGIGNIESGTDVVITHGPPYISSNCSFVFPNPVPLDAIITNLDTVTIENVTATLDLSNSLLTLSDGDNPQNLGSIAGYGGGKVANWSVAIPPEAHGTTQCYDIIVNWDGGGPVSENFCIDIPQTTDLSVTAIVDDSALCFGDSTRLYALFDTSEVPGHNWYYTWRPAYFLSDSEIASPIARPETSITYWVVVFDSGFCIDSDMVSITVEPNPIVLLEDTTICLGDSAILLPEIIPDVPGYSYLWTPNGETTRQITVMPSVSTTYGLTVTSPASCFGYDECMVHIDPEIVVDAGATQEIFRGDSVVLGGAPSASGGDGTYYYFWEPQARLNNPNSANPKASPESTTTYTLTVVDGIGCSGYDTITVIVNFRSACRAYPNPFTPDGDEINDFVVFDYPEMAREDAELSIFDIRNTLVYRATIGPVRGSSDYESHSWLGLDMENDKLSPGLYIYVIKEEGVVICNGTVVLAE